MRTPIWEYCLYVITCRDKDIEIYMWWFLSIGACTRVPLSELQLVENEMSLKSVTDRFGHTNILTIFFSSGIY